MPHFASSATSRMSVWSASVRPSPTAWPLIAAITGLRTSHAWKSNGSERNSRGSGAAKVSPPRCRSAPAQNARPAPGEDDGADVVVGVAGAVRVVELVAHLGAERVEHFGAVQREHRDAVGDVDEDVRLAHRTQAGHVVEVADAVGDLAPPIEDGGVLLVLVDGGVAS